MAPDPTFAFVGGPYSPTLDLVCEICDKKNLPWFVVGYDYHPTCVFSIYRQGSGIENTQLVGL
jgi:hypothetical protein